MGYCIEQLATDFRIPAANKAECLAAIKALAGQETCQDSTGAHFSWVDSEFMNAHNLIDVLLCWRWLAREDWFTNDIEHLEFQGEKLGDESLLFSAIAPYVASGSFIEMLGEDHRLWRWMFQDGQVKEVWPDWHW